MTTEKQTATLLSTRLATVARFIPQGAVVADIGTDHAYLPIYLIHEGVSPRVIASDVVAGPVASATRNVKEAQVTNQVSVRRGDGLTTITPDDGVTCVVIAGMGGALITTILDAGQDHLQHTERLILQPNVGSDRVRTWLADHRYRIAAEQILNEDGHVYEIIVADPVAAPVPLSTADILLGPHLRQEKNTVWRAYWQDRQAHNQTLLADLHQAQTDQTEKIEAVQAEQQLIERELA
ncbi:tRNA (adenine(22)-N(1))-methyltransferase [Schleiferilactobacillus shenzhenensis]|uniref:TrmK n=1 Tax=Schleiferilactobacillus shenzhenensis LY-73 TaxID=1231336 RepID=U4TP92_9LACO|nr:tRNA (adenine(22)-N(1))-methyltransferase TrmK [Schleiferilactobacillus shenzhenensis]ERL66716.1 TrmK [Schleiferilactobacillus shenzhenensis LY-73]